MSLSRIKRLPTSGGYIDTYSNGNDIAASVWVSPCHSHDEARELMIDFLMHCMLDKLPEGSKKGLEIGNVVFSGVNEVETSLVFVRDNFFIRVHSIGEKDYAVDEFSKVIDESIID